MFDAARMLGTPRIIIVTKLLGAARMLGAARIGGTLGGYNSQDFKYKYLGDWQEC